MPEVFELIHNSFHAGEFFSAERLPWLFVGVFVFVFLFAALSLVESAKPQNPLPNSNPSAVLRIALGSFMFVIGFPWAFLSVIGLCGFIESIPQEALIWLLAGVSLAFNAWILYWAGGRIAKTVSKFHTLHSIIMGLLACAFDIMFGFLFGLIHGQQLHGSSLVFGYEWVNYIGMTIGAFVGADLAKG